MIRHAIQEYEHGPRQMVKFEGQIVESRKLYGLKTGGSANKSLEAYTQIRDLWYCQMADRRERVRIALRAIVIKIAGTTDYHNEEEIENFAFKDSLEDLDDLDYDSDPIYSSRGQGRVTGPSVDEVTSTYEESCCSIVFIYG